jgi:anaerobic magnesium-protoporphyrin IX monomethyl ester cyclase
MTKILFINPNTRHLGQRLTVFPPMGILYISSMLIKAGYDVKVVDADTDNLSFYDIQGAVSEYRPEIIGITMNTLQSRAVFEIAEQLKTLNDLKIVVGGPHPSALKGEILKRCEAIDAVVFGEGEETFL